MKSLIMNDKQLFENYKSLVKAIDKSKLPIKGVPEFRYLDSVLVKLDRRRTPRLNKLKLWAEQAGLRICGYHHDFNRKIRLDRPLEKELQYQYEVVVMFND